MELRRAGGGRGALMGLRRRVAPRAVLHHDNRPEGDAHRHHRPSRIDRSHVRAHDAAPAVRRVESGDLRCAADAAPCRARRVRPAGRVLPRRIRPRRRAGAQAARPRGAAAAGPHRAAAAPAARTRSSCWRAGAAPATAAKDAERAILLASASSGSAAHAPAAALYDEPFPRGAGTGARARARLLARATATGCAREYDEAERARSREHAPGRRAGARAGAATCSAGSRSSGATTRPRRATSRRRWTPSTRCARPTRVRGSRRWPASPIVAVETLDFGLHQRLVAGYERSLRTPRHQARAVPDRARAGAARTGCKATTKPPFASPPALQNQAEQNFERVLAHVTLAEFLRVRGDHTGPKLHLELAAADAALRAALARQRRRR